jgi:hypothetical protein
VISLYEVGHLARVPLGTSYVAIAMHLRDLLARLPPGTEAVIDETGVGQAVAEIFLSCGITPTRVTITGGDQVNGVEPAFRVPKLDLISTVQALLDQRLLKIQRDLPEAEILVRELKDYVVQFTPLGAMTFNARSGKHDDVILALALACWRATGGGQRCRGLFEYYERELAASAPAKYFVGVDLGKVNDFTAIAVVKRTQADPADMATEVHPEPGALYEAPEAPEPPPRPREPPPTYPIFGAHPDEPPVMVPARRPGGGIRWIPRAG